MLHDADALATGCSKLLPDDFSNPTNVIIFNIIKGLHASNKIIATAAILDVIKSTPKYAFTDAHIIVEQLYASFSHTLELETKLEMIKNNTCHNLLNKLCDKVKTDKFNIMNTDEELLKVRDELDQIMMRKSHASFTMVADTVAGLKK
jgi:replicative DNA helicase